MSGDGRAAAEKVRSLTNLKIGFGLILGSGLGALADAISDGVHIPYEDLPGLPLPIVSSHAGMLHVGRLEGIGVAILAGRSHYYENGSAGAMRAPIGMLKHLGCHSLILTNAAGAVRDSLSPGSLMVIADHINFSGANPLIGEASDRRFVGLTNAYDGAHKSALLRAALEEGISIEDGVYAWFSGPSFETPAEIRAIRTLGADAVGMSTVPEAILARFFGLRVLAVSVITNYAAGMTGAEITHEETKAMAPLGAAKLALVLRRFFADAAKA